MKRHKSTFYCFSPPVMIATFVIEFLLALFVLYRYRRNTKMYTILSILICLALFQLAEYFVCTQSNYAILASRLGYVAITFLPVIGLYLLSLITTRIDKIVKILFVIASIIALYYFFVPNVFDGYQCTGNYVIFQIGNTETILYSLYYFGVMLFSLIKGLLFVKNNQNSKYVPAVKWYVAGYALFIIPTSIMIVIQPDASKALPSVLCGFAITLAIILTIKVAPLILTKKDSGN